MRMIFPLDRVAELELRRRAFCILAPTHIGFPQWCREASGPRRIGCDAGQGLTRDKEVNHVTS
jgi:hypothetical protein